MKDRRKPKTSALQRVLQLAAACIGLVFLAPVVWMVWTSLHTEQSGMFTAVNYRKVLVEAPMFVWFRNSLLVSACITFLVLLVDSLAAYALSRLRFPFKRALFVLILTGLMIPAETLVVPLYLQFSKLGLLNQLYTLVLPAVAGPLGVFVLKPFFDGIPKDLEEAARMDGAGTLRIWSTLFLPLARPALSALAILTFINAWNDYFWPLVSVTEKSRMTVTLGLPTFQSAYLQTYALPMTANTLATLPVLLLFLLFQKQIMKGIAFTGGKEG